MTDAADRPRQAPGVQAARSATAAGGVVYVLHSPAAGTYVQLDAPNYFLWELMDGEHDLGSLAMAYYERFGALPLDRLSALLGELRAAALLDGAEPDGGAAQAPATRAERVAGSAFRREFAWSAADAFYTGLYDRLGRVLFAPPAYTAFAALAVAGLACFVYLFAATDYKVFSVDGSVGLALIALMLADFVLIFLHESGHALTCKRFGRRVRKAGLMFYFGRPAFFVDASDMWMAERWPRIWVSLAGPLVNLLFGGALSIIAVLLVPSVLSQVLFVAAFVAYLNGLLNLNPLLELDGYYVLLDWTRTRQLRRRSFAFVRQDLGRKLRSRERFTHEERMFAVYGVLAVGFTALTVVLAVLVLLREVRIIVQAVGSGDDVLAVVLVGALTVAAATWLVVGLFARVLVHARRRRARGRTSLPEGGEGPH